MKYLAAILGVALSGYAPADTEGSKSLEANKLAKQVLEHGITSLGPVDILAWADMPRTAEVGETIVLRITIENGRDSKPFHLESIDIGGSFGTGFDLKSVRPTPSVRESLLNTLSLEYSVLVPAGEQVTFELELTAKRVGVYIGEVDIWESDNFLTRLAQCRVTQ